MTGQIAIRVGSSLVGQVTSPSLLGPGQLSKAVMPAKMML